MRSNIGSLRLKLKTQAFGLVVALMIKAHAAYACSSFGEVAWRVSDTASARSLANVIAECGGGVVSVDWEGTVYIDQTIHVQNGTMLQVASFGTTPAVVDGQGQHRLFLVSNASLHLSDMILAHGNASSGGGGAIAASASTLTFVNTSFERNTATSGGAVDALQESAAWWHGTSTFIDNHASSAGGAVAASETSNLSWMAASNFSRNYCHSDECKGGAVFLGSTSSATWVAETSFENNSAQSNGGAVAIMSGSTASFASSATFRNNTSGSFGGAVSAVGSALSFEGDAHFASNRADNNAGAAYADHSKMSWSGNVEFIGNEASGYAGAVAAQEYSDVSWTSHAAFVGNSGGIFAGAVLVGNHSSALWTSETLFLGNTAEVNGGGLFIGQSSSVGWIARIHFESNHAGADGGGIASSLGFLDYDEDEDGSSLFVNGSTTFANNTCDGSGGAIMVTRVLSVSFGTTEEVIFANNSAGASGGGVFASGVGVGISFPGVKFLMNSAVVGGGMYASGSGTTKTRAGSGTAATSNPTTFIGCDFIANTASATGGAIESAAGEDYIVSSSFIGNTAGVGGALRLAGTSTLENCSFVENSATEDEGPAVSNIGAIQNVSHTSFVNNLYDCDTGKYLDFEESVVAFESVCSGCGQECVGCTFQGRNPQCTEVMDNTHVAGSQATIEHVLIDEGYWRATNTSTIILACYNEDACLGGITGSDGFCEDGYEGPYCSVCASGYSPSLESTCAVCHTRQGGVAVAIVSGLVCLAILVAFLSYMTSPESGGLRGGAKVLVYIFRRTPMQTVKIMIVTWQILTQMMAIAHLIYPGIYGDFLSLVDTINFDLSWILSTGCLMDLDFHDRLLAVTVGPIACASALGLTYIVAIRRARGADRGAAVARVRKKHLTAIILLTFLVYSSASSALFRMFPCERLDDGMNYLRADYRIDCSSTKHRVLQMYAGFMIALYPVGIPLVYAGLLFRNRDVLAREGAREKDARVQSTSHLWKPYRPSCFYYELIECARRVLLTGAVVFIYPDDPAQIAISLIIAVVFIFTSEILAPYSSRWDTWISRAGHAIVFSSLNLSLLTMVDPADEHGESEQAFEIVLVAAHVLVVIAVLVEAVLLTWALREEQLEDSKHQVHPRIKTTHGGRPYSVRVDSEDRPTWRADTPSPVWTGTPRTQVSQTVMAP